MATVRNRIERLARHCKAQDKPELERCTEFTRAVETFIGFVKADAETSLERAIEYLSSWGPHKNSHGDVRKILIAVAMLEHGYGKDAKLIEADLPWLEAIETLYQQKSAKLGNEEDQKWVDKQSPDTGIPGDSNTLN